MSNNPTIIDSDSSVCLACKIECCLDCDCCKCPLKVNYDTFIEEKELEMIKSVCCIHDEVSGQFMSVVCEDNVEYAKRSFMASVWKSQAEEEGLFWTNPSDFTLYHVGDFDTETGLLAPVVPIVRVMNAGDAVLGYNRYLESEDK